MESTDVLDSLTTNSSMYDILFIVGGILVVGIAIVTLITLIKLLRMSSEEYFVDKIHNELKQDRSFLNLSKMRYSVRAFTSDKIEDNVLSNILEAGRIAPTATNAQPQRIFVLRSEAARERISSCCNTYNATVVILICADINSAWVNSVGQNTSQIDATIVTTQMMNEATSNNVATVWICSYDEQEIRSAFKLPENIVPVNILAMGYPTEKLDKSNRYANERKPLNETVKIL